jgi:hypothetical protein
MCSRGIRPGVGQRLEASACLGDCVEDIEQVAGRPPTPHFHGSDNPARVVSFCHEESALVPSQKALMGSKAAFGSGRNTIPLHTLTADITWKRVPTPLTWNAACNAIRDHHT